MVNGIEQVKETSVYIGRFIGDLFEQKVEGEKFFTIEDANTGEKYQCTTYSDMFMYGVVSKDIQLLLKSEWDNPRITIKTGAYKHFKNKYYNVFGIASDLDNNRLVVVYRALYGDFKVYARELHEFMSKIDYNREDNITKQHYRFEKCDDCLEDIKALTRTNTKA